MKCLKHLGLLFFFLTPFVLLAQSNPAGDWKYAVPDGQGGTITFRVSMKADNTYAVDMGMDGSIDIKGTYKLDGNQITIQDDPGSDCTGKGVYTFAIEGDTLTFTEVSEACQNRGTPNGKMMMTRM